MATMEKFIELRDEFLKNNDRNAFYIFKKVFSHWLFNKDQTVGNIYIIGTSSRHLVTVDNILSRLGYHHYSIDCSDPTALIIKLRNSL